MFVLLVPMLMLMSQVLALAQAAFELTLTPLLMSYGKPEQS